MNMDDRGASSGCFSRGLLCSWILFGVIDPRFQPLIPRPIAAVRIEANQWPIDKVNSLGTLVGGQTGVRRMAMAGPVSILDAIIGHLVVTACAAPLLVSLNRAILNL